MIGFLNIYRSGFFHREGKPGMFNRHGGDVYETLAAARANIHPHSHYIDTVQVEWVEEIALLPNAHDSAPTPLSVSRKEWYRKHPEHSGHLDILAEDRPVRHA